MNVNEAFALGFLLGFGLAFLQAYLSFKQNTNPKSASGRSRKRSKAST